MQQPPAMDRFGARVWLAGNGLQQALLEAIIQEPLPVEPETRDHRPRGVAAQQPPASRPGDALPVNRRGNPAAYIFRGPEQAGPLGDFQTGGVKPGHGHELVAVGENRARQALHLPGQGLEAMGLAQDALLVVGQGQDAGPGVEQIEADEEHIGPRRCQQGAAITRRGQDRQGDPASR